jgi:DNA repair protein RecN (Recombination protein N)
LLRFERDELDQAALKLGETAALARERERLAHAQSVQEFTAASCARLYDDEGSVSEQLGKLLREAQHWSTLDPTLAELAQRLLALEVETQDLAECFRAASQQWDADPQRREEVEERLQLLRRLEKKYGKTSDALLDYRASLDGDMARLQQQEDDRENLRAELAEKFARLRVLGTELSELRGLAGKKLASAVQRELADLGMAGACLDAQLEPIVLTDDPLTAEIPLWGLEHLELTLAANRGEPARPLRKVASGGELSRAMLALKTVLAAQDHVGTLVFDEIDANVGGRLGDVLGEKLAALGRSHQVICVTHLPQVASYARHQWTIRKARQGNRTTTRIELLDTEARIEELASMLRGKSRSATTRKEAAAMLTAAKRRW